MINGIFKQESVTNMPAAEIKSRSLQRAEKTEIKQEKTVESEDIKKDEKIETEEAVERILNTANFYNRKIRIEIEEELNIMIVKVIDSETEEVIRQIPPEELIALSKNARDLKGLLINKEG